MTDWIKHDGTGCPVSGDVVVAVRTRGGNNYTKRAGDWSAEAWRDGLITHYRIVEQPLRRDVREFGVVGDGVTDDTVAMQAAVAWAQKTGGMAVIPDGLKVCYISSTWSMTAEQPPAPKRQHVTDAAWKAMERWFNKAGSHPGLRETYDNIHSRMGCILVTVAEWEARAPADSVDFTADVIAARDAEIARLTAELAEARTALRDEMDENDRTTDAWEAECQRLIGLLQQRGIEHRTPEELASYPRRAALLSALPDLLNPRLGGERGR